MWKWNLLSFSASIIYELFLVILDSMVIIHREHQIKGNFVQNILLAFTERERDSMIHPFLYSMEEEKFQNCNV